MLAIGMALIYRANRVVNFAQADLGSVPTAFAAAFILFWGWPYLLGLGAGLVMAIVAGVVVELAIVRRFRHSPRLVVTVATLGITQLMVVLGILVPRWWGRNLASERIAPPLDWKLTVGHVHPQRQRHDRVDRRAAGDRRRRVVPGAQPIRPGDPGQRRARRSRRDARHPRRPDQHASCGRSPRLLSFVALFLHSGITGVPLGYAVGLPTLLQALAALVIGRLERLPTIVAMAVRARSARVGRAVELRHSAARRLPDHGRGHVRRAAGAAHQSARVATTTPPAVARRRGGPPAAGRRRRPPVDQHRPLDARGRRRWRWCSVPRSCSPSTTSSRRRRLIAFAIIGMSLVVLTGWAGQISLGQMGIVGVGAAVSATCTSRWNVDLSLGAVDRRRCRAGSWRSPSACRRCGCVACTSPSPRSRSASRRAVVAAERSLLRVVPQGRLALRAAAAVRPDRRRARRRATTCTRCRRRCLVYVAVRGIRRSRTGRVIIAVRENERAAQSFAVSVVRAKLTAFVISGARRRHRRRAVRAPQPVVQS